MSEIISIKVPVLGSNGNREFYINLDFQFFLTISQSFDRWNIIWFHWCTYRRNY